MGDLRSLGFYSFILLHLLINCKKESSIYNKDKKATLNELPFCAQNRNRTCTSLRILDFESSASTNSAIWAF